MNSFNWTCPYCNRDQAVTEQQFSQERGYIYNEKSVYGPICFNIESIRCANDECKQLQLAFFLHKARYNQHGAHSRLDIIQDWQLLPESSARPQPEYIPRQIVEDYTEACRIRNLSPKASATLSRRCLQGMIRDFCGIQDKTLYKEIDSLRKRIDEGEGVKHVHQDTVDAIDQVRKIGNIGAHMEQDVDLIINVEPIEAQKLIELIELLFDEWYVQRETRKQKLESLKDIADKKEEQRKENSS